jgi:hypothetical protein
MERFSCGLMINLEKLVNDLLNGTNTDQSNMSRRSSRINVDEVKAVKFAPPAKIGSSRNKNDSNNVPTLTSAQPEEMNTISTIRTLLQ